MIGNAMTKHIINRALGAVTTTYPRLEDMDPDMASDALYIAASGFFRKRGLDMAYSGPDHSCSGCAARRTKHLQV